MKRFDINAGCPSTNTVQNGDGAALMKKPGVLAGIGKAVKRETELPVSVKMRIFGDKEKTIKLAREMEDIGTDFLIIHGRTAEQGYSGTADWDMIRAVKESISIPVVGNGDVKSVGDGHSRIKDGFCNSFMIGRAAMSNPLVFRDKTELDYEQRKKIFLEYVGLCHKMGCVELNDLKLKALQFFRNISDGPKIRHQISQDKTVEGLLNKINGTQEV